MKKNKSRIGMTLVEVMIAMALVSVAAVIVYTEMLLAYRTLMRSRARIEAQNIAFDHLWTYYNNTKILSLPTVAETVYSVRTPQWSLLSSNGWVDLSVIPAVADTNNFIPNWVMIVTVWPPSNSVLRIGTNALARTAITRYNTADRKESL